jgi:DNA-binding response OmpR family regulator
MTNAPHILVIDDEPQIVSALQTIFTERQFRVTTAADADHTEYLRVYMRQLRKKLEAEAIVYRG